MTNEEALNLFKEIYSLKSEIVDTDVDAAVEKAIEVLEKQTAKKPLNIENNTLIEENKGDIQIVKAIYFDCPCCGKRVVSKRYTISHCPCGQKLDWSDYE